MSRGTRWRFYPGQVNDSPAWLGADMEWLECDPDPALGTWIDLHAPVRNTDADGLRTDLESDADIRGVSEALRKAMRTVCGAVHVGMLSTSGRVHWFFYGRSSVGVHEAARRVLPADCPLFNGPVEAWCEPDGDWLQFSELFTPDDVQECFIDAREQAADMLLAGAKPGSPCVVVHEAFFASEKTGRQFIAWAEEAGLRVIALERDGGHEARWTVRLSGQATVDPDLLAEQAVACSLAAAELGGLYQGWGATVSGKP